jgi:hypothetical protein
LKTAPDISGAVFYFPPRSAKRCCGARKAWPPFSPPSGFSFREALRRTLKPPPLREYEGAADLYSRELPDLIRSDTVQRKSITLIRKRERIAHWPMDAAGPAE